MLENTGSVISRTALELKTAYLGLLVAAQLAVLPGQPLLAAWRSIWPHIPDPTLKLSAPDGSSEQYRVAQVLEELSTMGYESMGSTVLRSAQIATAVTVGDLVTQSAKYDPTDPLHQFLRHYRNGCAHGDRWNVHSDALKNPAQFMDIAVDDSMNGHRTTDAVSPLRHIQVLQAVSDYFGPPTPKNNADGWRAVPPS